MGKDIAADLAVIRVCTGEHCSESKASKLRKRLERAVEDRGLGGAIKVRCASCREHCGNGPVVEIRPSGVVLEQVKPRRAESLIDDLVAGRMLSA